MIRSNYKNKILNSIVISGWPAVGKTTIATELAKEFGYKHYNGGDVLKMLAAEKGYLVSGNDWWDTEEAKNFMEERESNSYFDIEVDRKLVQIVRMAKRDSLNLKQARDVIQQRDDNNVRIYNNLYGYEFGKDLSVFDFVLDTDLLNLDSLLLISKIIVKYLRI